MNAEPPSQSRGLIIESGFDDPGANSVALYPPMTQEYMGLVDRAEKIMLDKFKVEECPVTHVFLPGLYIRTIFMRKGLLITSKIHVTEHRYAVLWGEVAVRMEDGVKILRGGDQGVTMPGTRRVLNIIADTLWSTFHQISEDEHGDVDAIEKRIILPHENKLLSSGEALR